MPALAMGPADASVRASEAGWFGFAWTLAAAAKKKQRRGDGKGRRRCRSDDENDRKGTELGNGENGVFGFFFSSAADAWVPRSYRSMHGTNPRRSGGGVASSCILRT